MDADWEFKRKCEEAIEEVWQEAIQRILTGEGNRYVEDRITEAADGAVPIYTYELYKLVEYLDEYWDDVHKDSKTLDDALRYSCFMKASDYCYSAFNEKGGLETLEELEDTFKEYLNLAESLDHKGVADLFKSKAKHMEMLGIVEELPKAEDFAFKFNKSSYN